MASTPTRELARFRPVVSATVILDRIHDILSGEHEHSADDWLLCFIEIVREGLKIDEGTSTTRPPESKLRIRGRLDLSNLSCKLSISFRNCHFEDHVTLAYSRFKSVHFHNCTVSTLDAMGLIVEDDFSFAATNGSDGEAIAHGTVRLTNAEIGKRLILNGASFNEGTKSELARFTFASEVPPRGALDAGGIRVGGTIWMDDVDVSGRKQGFRANGLVSFRGARIKGKLNCIGAHVTAGRNITQAKIGEEALRFLSNLKGAFRNEKFITSEILLPFIANVIKPTDIPSSLDHPKCWESLRDTWTQNARRFKIDGECLTTEDYIRTTVSLDLYNAEVIGSVNIRNSQFDGTVRLSGMSIVGRLSIKSSLFAECSLENVILQPKCSALYNIAWFGLSFHNYVGSSAVLPRGAIDAHRIKTTGSVYLMASRRRFLRRNINYIEDAQAKGDYLGTRKPLVRLTENSHLEDEIRGVYGEPEVIAAEDTTRGELFYSFGRTSFSGADIGGRFVVSGAYFVRLGQTLFESGNSVATLELSNATISRNLSISDNTVSVGTVLLTNATIKGSLQVSASLFVSKSEKNPAFNAASLDVSNELKVEQRSSFYGQTSFHGSCIRNNGTLTDSGFFGYPKGSNADDQIRMLLTQARKEPKHSLREGIAANADGLFTKLRKWISGEHRRFFQDRERQAQKVVQDNNASTSAIQNEGLPEEENIEISKIHKSLRTVVVDFSESVINGSLRFSSPYEREGYILAMGTVILEGAKISTELDICCLDRRLTGVLLSYFDENSRYSFSPGKNNQPRQVGGVKGYADNIPSIFAMPSIWRFDLRYVSTKVFRANGNLPFPGMMLVNGLKFSTISGEILKSIEIAEKIIIASSFVTDDNGVQIHKLGYGVGDRNLTDSITLKLHQGFCRNLLVCYKEQAPHDEYLELVQRITPALSMEVKWSDRGHRRKKSVPEGRSERGQSAKKKKSVSSLRILILCSLAAFFLLWHTDFTPLVHKLFPGASYSHEERLFYLNIVEFVVSVSAVIGMGFMACIHNRNSARLLRDAITRSKGAVYFLEKKKAVIEDASSSMAKLTNSFTYYGHKPAVALLSTLLVCMLVSAAMVSPWARTASDFHRVAGGEEVVPAFGSSVTESGLSLIETHFEVLAIALPSLSGPAERINRVTGPAESKGNEKTGLVRHDEILPWGYRVTQMVVRVSLVAVNVLGWMTLIMIGASLQNILRDARPSRL